MKFSSKQLFDLLKIILGFLVLNFLPEGAPVESINSVIHWILGLVLLGDGGTRAIRTAFNLDQGNDKTYKEYKNRRNKTDPIRSD